MDWATVVVSLLLIGVSAILTVLHIRSRHNEKKLFCAERFKSRFFKKQFARRIQIGLMLGITGIAMLGSQWLPHHALLFGWYWLGITAWVLWILLLGLVDVFATHRHFAKQQHDQWIQQVKQPVPPES
tara:strand:+ start:61 stop:444 length:384 start_codon:yes stop_codon:yes gene_type:complete